MSATLVTANASNVAQAPNASICSQLPNRVYKISPVLWECFKQIDRARNAGHDHTRKSHEVVSETSTLYGTAGEMYTLHLLFRAGLIPEDWTVVSDHVPMGADFSLKGGARFEVKTVLPKSSFVYCNEAQRLNPKHNADFLLPCRFVGPREIDFLQPVPYSEVAKWKLRDGHSPYRSVAISTLKPLANLRDLETLRPIEVTTFDH